MHDIQHKQTHSKVISISIAFLLLTYAGIAAIAQTIEDYIPNEWQDSRYIDHNNGTVTDTKTELMWAKCSLGQHITTCSGTATTHTWKDALEQANNSTLAGHSDWHLPNTKELISLVARDRHGPSINSSIFPHTPNALLSWFWSSSPRADNNSQAWVVHFSYGNDSNNSRHFDNHVRLVRSSQ